MRNRIALYSLIAPFVLSAAAFAQHEHAEGHTPDDTASASPAAVEAQPVVKDEEVKPSTGLHGGRVQRVGAFQLEHVVGHAGIRLFAYDDQGKPLDVRAARGLAIARFKGDAKRYRYDMFPEVARDGSAQSLAAAVDLSRVSGKEAELVFKIVGLADAQRRLIQYQASATVPLSEAQRVAAAIEKQRTCPVTGQPLGSMGKPVAVTIGEETLYVCCAGCIDAIKASPQKFLPKPTKLAMAPAAKSDAAAIARQKLCPVMDEPLGSMGTPMKVTGLDRDVFLCCKGCLKFLEKDPQRYLTKLTSQGVAPPSE